MHCVLVATDQIPHAHHRTPFSVHAQLQQSQRDTRTAPPSISIHASTSQAARFAMRAMTHPDNIVPA